MRKVQLTNGLFVASRILGSKGFEQSERDLLKEVVKLDPKEGVLRRLLVLSRDADDIETAWDCANRLTALYDAGSAEMAWVEKATQKNNRMMLHKLVAQLDQKAPPEPEFTPVPNRILYVLHSSLPFSSNGYSTRGHGVAKGMIANGVDLVCVTRPGFPFDLYADNVPPFDVPDKSEVDGVVYHHLPTPSRREMRVPATYLEVATQVMVAQIKAARPSCVIAGSNHTTALPACLAAHQLGVPFIYEVRGFWEVTRLSRDPEFVTTNSYKDQVFLETVTAQAAHCVLTLTSAMNDLLQTRGVAKDAIYMLPNSFDPSTFIKQTRDKDLAKKLGIPEGVPVIGYVGSFVGYEGLQDLARACAKLQEENLDFRLLLVGSENAVGQDRGPLTESILQAASDGGIADKLILPGRVPHEEVAAYYSLIDICPFPRRPLPVTELVSPLKPIEALAMEKAVVVSSVQALEEMITHEKTGLIYEKGNVDAIASTLLRLVADPALRDRLGQEGARWAVTERTWSHTVGQALKAVHKAGNITFEGVIA